MAKLQISEIFEKLKEFTGDGATTKKIEWLKKHDSNTLRMLLQHNFDPNIAYNLPEGDPPFKRNDAPAADLTESTLYAETRKLSYLWLQPSNSALSTLTKTQKEQVEELQVIETAKSKELQDKILEYRNAEKEIEDAREAIEQAKLRLKRAIDTAQRVMKEGQQLNKEVEAVSQNVQSRMRSIVGANAELLNRAQPNQAPAAPKYRLEMQFIQLLESLSSAEADILLAVKSKTLQKKYPVTKDIAKKAFPDLLSA